MTISNPAGSAAFKTIFVGSSLDLDQLSSSAISIPLLADGDIGMYGHMSGIVNAFNQGLEGTVLSVWGAASSGLVETTQEQPMAIMGISVMNTGESAIRIPVGTMVSSSSGAKYTILAYQDPSPGWSDTDTGAGTLGYYTILPGQTLSLYAQSNTDGPSGNCIPDSVSHIDVDNAKITGSTLIDAATQWSGGTVTLTNSSTSSVDLYERTLLVGTNGNYQIGVDNTLPQFVSTNADGGAGYYVLAAGSKITVPFGSVLNPTATTQDGVVAQENMQNAPPNSITGGQLPPGVIISSSSAITTQGIFDSTQQGRLTTLGSNNGLFTESLSGLWLSGQGYNPTEANVNTTNSYIWTQEDLTNWEAYVDNARAVGILNLAPMMSEFEAVDFATSQATQYMRAAILYSGGMAFDMPPWFFLAREENFRQQTYEEIRWANQNGIRSSITLSPETGNDGDFFLDTEQMISLLQSNGALPSQIVVKDGGVTGGSVIYSTTDPNSLNKVGDWLSSLKLSPTNSESGLESPTALGRPDDLMTGVQQSICVVGNNAVLPFQSAQVFSETKINLITLTVTLANALSGRLATSGLGTVSDNGSAFVVSGTPTAVSSALQALTFTASLGYSGTTNLLTTVSDSVGIITGSTSISINNALQASVSGYPSLLSEEAVGNSSLGFSLSFLNDPNNLRLSIHLSSVELGTLYSSSSSNTLISGQYASYSGTATQLKEFLSGLVFTPNTGAVGVETCSVVLTDGTQTVSVDPVIAVYDGKTTLLDSVAKADAVIAGADANFDVIGPGSMCPLLHAQVLSNNSSAILTATVKLDNGGCGSLTASNMGAVSADGLVYTVTGTAYELSSELSALVFTPNCECLGKVTITTTLSDVIGSSSVVTQLNVDNALRISGLSTEQTAYGVLFPNRPVEIYYTDPQAKITATVSLSDLSLGGFWNYASGTLSSDESTITYTGTAAEIQNYLWGLRFIARPDAVGIETETVTLTDGTTTASGSTAIAVSHVSGIAISEVDTLDIELIGQLCNPYADILISKTSAPTQILSLSVQLTSGPARIVSGSLGSYSPDGSSFNFNGNVAQIQSALRNLQVIAPAGSEPFSQTLELNINGHTSVLQMQFAANAPETAITLTGLSNTMETTGGVSLNPFCNLSIADTNSDDYVTAIVSVTDANLGQLTTNGGGSVSADGSLLTIVGKLSNVNKSLQLVKFLPSTAISGSTSLNLNLSDSDSKYSTSSIISVDNNHIPISISALPDSSPSANVTILVTPTNGGLYSATDRGNISGGTFIATGGVSAVATAISEVFTSSSNPPSQKNYEIFIKGNGLSVTDRGQGNDTITSAGSNEITLGSGSVMVNAGRWDTICAGSGSVSAGSDQPFVFLGGASGNDTITAGGGDLYAGVGGKSLLIGQSQLVGLHAAGGNDTLVGGGSSIMYGAAGLHTDIRMKSGDTAVGFDTDTISAPVSGNSVSNIFLSGGHETVTGGAGYAVIHNNSVNSEINLSGGKITVVGGAGCDTVRIGDSSSLTSLHGSGQETVVITRDLADGATVTLMDFSDDHDHVVLSGYGQQNVQAALAMQTTTAIGTTLNLPDGTSIVFGNVSHISLSQLSIL